MSLREFLSSLVLVCAFSAAAYAGPASGQINGKTWSFVAGAAKIGGDGNLTVNLWNQAMDSACDVFTMSTLNARAVFPAKAGTYAVSQDGPTNMLIFGDNTMPGDPSNNIMADHGSFTITSITDTTVTGTFSGGLQFMNTEVSGDFSVQLCK